MSKHKYTFFLNNTSKIVITDDSENIETVMANLKRILKSKNFSVFKTKTDMVIINPTKLDAVHISSIGDTLNEDDKYNDSIICEISSKDINETNVEYSDETDDLETKTNLTDEIDWSDDILVDELSEDDDTTELDIKPIEDEI